MADTGKPLRLKDLLELDCDSCSAAGFRCYPRRLVPESSPVRHLLESPSLRRGPSRLSHLSKSLSRRLRGGFWRRRDDDEEEASAARVSSGSGGSEPETETSSESSDNSSGSRRRSRSESDSDLSSATTASDSESMRAAAVATAAAGDEREEAMKRGSSSSGSEVDDKEEQLSPVAVMDFPFDDYGEDEKEGGSEEKERRDAAAGCSHSFSLARLQRRKTHQIRRFGSLDELGPVTLEARLAATSDTDGLADDDVLASQQLQRLAEATTPTCPSGGHRGADVHDVPDVHGLLALLMDSVSAGVDDVTERLLLDFVVEMRRRSDSEHADQLPAPAGLLRRKAARSVDAEVLGAARGWLDGTGAQRWGLDGVLRGGEAFVAEMERSRRWMQVGVEEREVGAVAAGMVIDELVDEVVWDLLA